MPLYYSNKVNKTSSEKVKTTTKPKLTFVKKKNKATIQILHKKDFVKEIY